MSFFGQLNNRFTKSVSCARVFVVRYYSEARLTLARRMARPTCESDTFGPISSPLNRVRIWKFIATTCQASKSEHLGLISSRLKSQRNIKLNPNFEARLFKTHYIGPEGSDLEVCAAIECARVPTLIRRHAARTRASETFSLKIEIISIKKWTDSFAEGDI